MATRYGKTFRTRRGRYGRYKYVNGRKVAFKPVKVKRAPPYYRNNKSSTYGRPRRRYIRRY